jgi:hypothetical protein
MLFDKITMIDYRRSLKERAESRKHAGPYTWTPCSAAKRKGIGFYQSSKGLAMDRAGSIVNLRLALASDLLPRHSRLRDTTGFYCDSFQDQTMIPVVARLPHGRGFLIGWTMGAGMAACLETDIYPAKDESDATDAARAAYRFAENEAERERVYQDTESARFEVGEKRGEIETARKDAAETRATIKTLAAEIRAAGQFSPDICKALREQVKSLRRDIRSLREDSRKAYARIEELARDYGAGILQEESEA